MLALGLASSYAPAMFRNPSEWSRIHDWLAADVAQSEELAKETSEIVEEHAHRVQGALGQLRDSLEGSRIDALIVLASDTGRLFSRIQMPQICPFLVDEMWGSTRFAELGEPAGADVIRVRCAPDLGSFLQQELVQRGFDLSYSRTLRPLGQPEYGASPAFLEPVRFLLSQLDLPVLPIHLNTQVSPAPSGHRCYALGTALAEVLAERPERVALLASGGLSHDHGGDRAGHIDEPFDRWVLDQLARGRGSSLAPIFDLESDALRGGAAHVRLWAAVAGACESFGKKAEIVDYIPSYTATVGLGFARWQMG